MIYATSLSPAVLPPGVRTSAGEEDVGCTLVSLPCSNILCGCITLFAGGAQGELHVLGPRSISILLTSFYSSGCREGLITSAGSCGCASEGRMWPDAV